ncbi:RsmB/NOP family class I SAM-dependent RNA methyltransferase [Desertibaculum subflavum]|uniref:RsmB/NOP family class I SAM-dependent RNA methyltransferase n=1 Tax=Desertibaculum subflavum TaxID=2268458 RepID=UPI000E67118D
MTPAARIAAAIELLEAIEAEGGMRAADRCVQGYFRARRYAGSKDRNDITERVYAVLRRRAELDWWLARHDVKPSARHRVAAALARLEHRPVAEIIPLFGEGAHAAAALDASETAMIDALASADPANVPAWVQGNYPPWLEGELKRRFGDDLASEMAALLERAPVDLRVNLLKGTREQALEALKVLRLEAAPTPLSPLGIRLGERAKIDDKAIHQSGLVEPQDEGSQLVALLTAAEPKMQVVDFCAGAGGKALALAAAMRNRGQIYACDSEASRLARINPRAQRAGARNIQTHRLTDAADDPFLAAMAGKADRVLVDAPCTGIGAWRRNPEARWRLTPERLTELTALQDSLLDRAAGLVKPGGRLIYATCSLLPSEGEDRIEAFLARHADFRALPVGEIWPSAASGTCPATGPWLALTPRRNSTDGFFVAILERSPGRDDPGHGPTV